MAFAFLFTALIYATAGFGGGSTYTALLVLADTDYRSIPIVSLCCNIVVVSVGSWRFAQGGYIHWRRILPLLVLSVPSAWLGGRIIVAEVYFVGVLAISLLGAAVLMLLEPQWKRLRVPTHGPWVAPLAGAVLGFVGGVVGIGGGIFLAPLLYVIRWAEERVIAGTCAVFILANSIAGLTGQLSKGGLTAAQVLAAHWLLLPSVFIGGLLGSTLATKTLKREHVRTVTALLVLYAAARLCKRFIQEMTSSAG